MISWLRSKKLIPDPFDSLSTTSCCHKTLWAIFGLIEQARAYGVQFMQFDGLRAQGIVPAALLEGTTPDHEISFSHVIQCRMEYPMLTLTAA